MPWNRGAALIGSTPRQFDANAGNNRHIDADFRRVSEDIFHYIKRWLAMVAPPILARGESRRIPEIVAARLLTFPPERTS
ncbi:MAG: hypothetical protein C0483_08920 [Pirellula sp.]|nr:hypothetical protein [Pirellula sp.]